MKKSKLKPKLFSVMKTYTREQFVKDVIAGIIVAIIALPLSIALALASGVTPEKGIYTAIIAGFIISFLGGSRVQIAGPTAAFATIVAGIVARNGMEGLVAAPLIAGILLILMGVFRLGNLIKFIPYTITTGFTAGIAVTIVIGQLKDFFGLTYANKEPLIETIDKAKAFYIWFSTVNKDALIVGVVSLFVLIFWPWINKIHFSENNKKNGLLRGIQHILNFLGKIPGSLIAVLAGILLVKGLGLHSNTIGDLYQISNKLPVFTMPKLSFGIFKNVFTDGFTIAMLAAIESLLSCVVADSMVNSKHSPNMELIAQGTGNIASVLFGGIPATGAIARTAANAKNGGRTPIAGMVHSVTLLLILVVLMPYAALIPMPTIAAILFIVAYNMSGWREVAHLVKTAPKSDAIVLVTTFFLTVVFDLVIAIEVGIVLAAVLFMKRMSEVTEVRGWKYIDTDGNIIDGIEGISEEENEENDSESISLRVVPKNTLVYEISGPMFFAAADKILGITLSEKTNCLILRMRSVNAIDATAMHSLEQLYKDCTKKKIHLILSHINEQPLSIMIKAGFIDKIGEENLCSHIDDALKRAESF